MENKTQIKKERLAALAILLGSRSCGWEEIFEALPEFYNGDNARSNRRNLDRDLSSLADLGHQVKIERNLGSRWVSYRLETAPPRPTPLPEKVTMVVKPPQNPLPDGELLAVDAAEYLGITQRRVRYLCANGKLPARRLGENHKFWVINRADLEEFARNRQGKVAV